MSEKRCPACGEVKTMDLFHRDSSRADGRHTYCKACRCADKLAWHKENRDSELARMRKYYADNADRLRSYARVYAAENHAEKYEYIKAWRVKNPERVAEYDRRNRALRANAAIIDRVERSVLWGRDGGICALCNTPADPDNWHIEHLTPLSRGGDHSYANTAVSHPRCNMSKGAKTLAEWFARP